jgi:hypothetical protein
MKKYLITFLTFVLLVPQVTLASWWNPLSWNIFNKNKVNQPSKTVEIATTSLVKSETEESKKTRRKESSS